MADDKKKISPERQKSLTARFYEITELKAQLKIAEGGYELESAQARRESGLDPDDRVGFGGEVLPGAPARALQIAKAREALAAAKKEADDAKAAREAAAEAAAAETAAAETAEK